MSKYINIDQIYIKNSDGLVKIRKHPYYRALKYNNKKLYEDEVNSSWIQWLKTSGDWKGFLDLKKIIEDEGIETTINHDPIFIIPLKDESYYCDHGRHRLCILRFLYKDKLQIKIRNTTLIKIKIK